MTGRTPSGDDPGDLISLTQLMKLLGDEPERAAHRPELDDGDTTPGTPPLPKVTRMPEGIEVKERRLGRAVGHWVLQVRCECGRRWFEVEDVATANCPRCGALVIVDIEPR